MGNLGDLILHTFDDYSLVSHDLLNPTRIISSDIFSRFYYQVINISDYFLFIYPVLVIA